MKLGVWNCTWVMLKDRFACESGLEPIRSQWQRKYTHPHCVAGSLEYNTPNKSCKAKQTNHLPTAKLVAYSQQHWPLKPWFCGGCKLLHKNSDIRCAWRDPCGLRGRVTHLELQGWSQYYYTAMYSKFEVHCVNRCLSTHRALEIQREPLHFFQTQWLVSRDLVSRDLFILRQNPS